MRLRRLIEDRGSSPVEFVLVGSLLTILTLGVLQLGLAVHVRNIVHDAAVEGAYHAALADATLGEGAARTALVIDRALSPSYSQHISASTTQAFGYPAVEIRVHTTLPVIGLIGVPAGLEVRAHAPLESFDE